MRKLNFKTCLLVAASLMFGINGLNAQNTEVSSVGPAPGTRVVEENFIAPDQVIQYTQEDFNMASPEKQQLILAHPEAYELVSSRPAVNQQTAPVIEKQNIIEQNNEVSVAETNSEPQVIKVPRSIFNSASPERIAYMQAHPENYIIVDDAELNIVREEKPVSDITKLLITKKELRKTSKEKRDYILSHPDEFEIIK